MMILSDNEVSQITFLSVYIARNSSYNVLSKLMSLGRKVDIIIHASDYYRNSTSSIPRDLLQLML